MDSKVHVNSSVLFEQSQMFECLLKMVDNGTSVFECRSLELLPFEL